MITWSGKYNSANVFIDDIDTTTREQIQGVVVTVRLYRSADYVYRATTSDIHPGESWELVGTHTYEFKEPR